MQAVRGKWRYICQCEIRSECLQLQPTAVLRRGFCCFNWVDLQPLSLLGTLEFCHKENTNNSCSLFPQLKKRSSLQWRISKGCVLGLISKNLITPSLSQHPKYSHVIKSVRSMTAVLWRDRLSQTFVLPKSIVYYSMCLFMTCSCLCQWFHQNSLRTERK